MIRALPALLLMALPLSSLVAAVPEIARHPEGRIVAAGSNVTFRVTANGTSPLSYQWQRSSIDQPAKWAIVPDATSAELLLTNIQLSEDRQLFRVEVSNAEGTVQSRSAPLRVFVPPRIATQTGNLKLRLFGGHFTLSAEAEGQKPFSYQWMKDGEVLSGAVSPLQSIAAEPGTKATYQLEVRNMVGSVRSAPMEVEIAHADTPHLWGEDSHGQLVAPLTLSRVISVAGGARHSMGLRDDGTVVCWGDDALGQCAVPESLSGVARISAGWNHNLALLRDGSLVGWGDNGYGQLDVPESACRFVSVSAGQHHSIAVNCDGDVFAWGRNNHGQLGIPPGLSSVVAVSAGANHNLALRADGTVVAWGRNNEGQCEVPAGLGEVVGIAAGGSHSLVVRRDGTMAAWGADAHGQASIPPGVGPVMAVACGLQHSVALRNDGSVTAWGRNAEGQVSVPGELPYIREIAAGGSHTMALPYSEQKDFGMSEPLNYDILPSRDILVVYNATNKESIQLRDYYRSHRPHFEDVNVLGIECRAASKANCATDECISEADYFTALEKPIVQWYADNPTTRPEYIILLLGVPSRVDFSSVSHRLHQAFARIKPIVTHVNMGDLDSCIAYVDKLKTIGGKFGGPGPYLQVDTSLYGNSRYYFDNRRPSRQRDDAFGQARVQAVLGSGCPVEHLTYMPHDGRNIRLLDSPLGYFSWGVHGGLGADYALNGTVTISGAGGWYLMQTIESFNGRRLDPRQGTFMKWFAPNAFGGAEYENTPVGAVTHVEEPFVTGVNDAGYFGLWTRGRSFGVAAWRSRNTSAFQAVGDPLVGILPLLVVAP